MPDVVDQATRSRMMAGIRGKNTQPELLLRRALHARGLRYRLHAKGLPGRPDLVLPSYRAAIQVQGCFWHRHSNCIYCTTPGSNTEFWNAKFKGTISRDKQNFRSLRKAGWRVAIVWECVLSPSNADATAEKVINWLRGGKALAEIPTKPKRRASKRSKIRRG